MIFKLIEPVIDHSLIYGGPQKNVSVRRPNKSRKKQVNLIEAVVYRVQQFLGREWLRQDVVNAKKLGNIQK